ncbi:MAG: hypothetical protein ACYSUA_16910 [Planctomycetota bacterium]|jgi:hypothetical protein
MQDELKSRKYARYTKHFKREDSWRLIRKAAQDGWRIVKTDLPVLEQEV